MRSLLPYACSSDILQLLLDPSVPARYVVGEVVSVIAELLAESSTRCGCGDMVVATSVSIAMLLGLARECNSVLFAVLAAEVIEASVVAAAEIARTGSCEPAKATLAKIDRVLNAADNALPIVCGTTR